MGYNQHNAGLHFVRYSSREDLSVYDRIVQRRRDEERIKLAYEAMKKKEMEEQKEAEEKARRDMEEQIRSDELYGIFTPEKLKEVRARRKTYYTPPVPDTVDKNSFYHKPSAFDQCEQKPGKKQLIDIEVLDYYPMTILENMLIIAFKKGKDLSYIIEAVQAIMHDDEIIHSEIYKLRQNPFSSAMVMLSLIAEALECKMTDLLKDENEADVQEFVYSAIDKLSPYDGDFSYDDDDNYVCIEYTSFEHLLDMSSYYRSRFFTSQPTLMIERWALIGGGYRYTVTFSISAIHAPSRAYYFGGTIEMYCEETGKLKDFTETAIAEDKKWQAEHTDI